MLYPEDFTEYDRYAERFGGRFSHLEPSGKFVYSIKDDTYNLSEENEKELLDNIRLGLDKNKNIIPEIYASKIFDPYPVKDAVY